MGQFHSEKSGIALLFPEHFPDWKLEKLGTQDERFNDLIFWWSVRHKNLDIPTECGYMNLIKGL